MSAYEQFEATHRVLAYDGDRVVACKSELVSKLGAAATGFRVGVHPTERGNLPDDAASLDVLSEPRATSTENELTWRGGKLPDDEGALQSIHSAMGDDGSLPASVLVFDGARFAGLVTASTSHSHVGKLRVHGSSSSGERSNDDFVTGLNDALENHGLVVPVGMIAAWERDGEYFEVSGSQLCVYAAPVAALSEEERLSVTHHCHDLSALRSVEADADSSEIALSWRSLNSIAARAGRRIFDSPPTHLAIPREAFSSVQSHLSRFVD